MSVLIKGVKIPRGCDECYIREKDTCPLLKVNVGEWGRLVGCPLIELPDHGDLIDRDAAADRLLEDAQSMKEIAFNCAGQAKDYYSGIKTGLTNASIIVGSWPAVIHAERSEG